MLKQFLNVSSSFLQQHLLYLKIKIYSFFIQCMWREAESVQPLMRPMILYNTFIIIIIMSNKQPYLNTFTHNKTIRLMWSVFMLIKFGVIYMTLTILRIKLKQTIWKIKMHNTELNPISDRGCRFKKKVCTEVGF